MKFNHIYNLEAGGIEEEHDYVNLHFLITKVESVDSGLTRGLHDSVGELFISVIGKSSFCFKEGRRFYPSYVREKLLLNQDEARVLCEKLNKLSGFDND